MAESPSNPASDFARLRVDYQQKSLDEQETFADPIRQFNAWLAEAVEAKANEPNAMTLATAAADRTPSARIVLLKGVDERGFVFYTNYASRKGDDLAHNPRAALLFYWPELERQIRVEGAVLRTSDEESTEYFNSRPVSARYGSAASRQSQPITSRQVLEDQERELWSRFPNGDLPRPSQWGGYRVAPARLEFWQGRPSRLHDRIEYLRQTTGWSRRRLSP